MSPRRLLPLLVLCSPWSPRRLRVVPANVRLGVTVRTAAPGARRRPGRSSLPVLVTNAIAMGKARILFLYLDDANAVASAPDRTAKVAFYNLDADPTKPVTTAEGAFVWTIEDERGMYVVDVDLPAAGTWGAEFTTEAPGSPRRDGPADVPRPRVDDRRSRSGRRHPPRRHRPLADVGGDVAKISTDADAGPGLLPDLGRRRAGRPQAVHARLRDAEVLHQPPSAARRSISSSRSRRPIPR